MTNEERKTLLERMRAEIAQRRALASLSPEKRRVAIAVAEATKQREKDRKAFMKENDSLQRLNDNDGYGNSYVQAFGGLTQALVQREGKARGFVKKEDGVWAIPRPGNQNG